MRRVFTWLVYDVMSESEINTYTILTTEVDLTFETFILGVSDECAHIVLWLIETYTEILAKISRCIHLRCRSTKFGRVSVDYDHFKVLSVKSYLTISVESFDGGFTQWFLFRRFPSR